MVVKILGDICYNGARKDCPNKSTCFYRHTNEIVGKDVEYYTSSLNRAAKAMKNSSQMSIESTNTSSIASLPNSFRVAEFVKTTVPGDGHCIIHSVLAALKQRHTLVPTTSEVLDKLKSTLQGDLDLLAPFINSNKTDPLAEIDAYIQLAKFNSNIVDLIIPLISKILDVGICVLQLDTDGVLYVTNDLLTSPC